MKKIWIDLENSPHVVFFKPITEELRKRGYQIVFTARNCFQVCGLADRLNIPYKRTGRHYGKNKLLKVIGLFARCFGMLPFVLKEKPVIALSHGSRSQLLLANILGIPSIVVTDYEFAAGMVGTCITLLITPEAIPEEMLTFKKLYSAKFPGIKEDVYVPDFKPDPSIKKELGFNEKDLVITIRPPATEAHYHNPESESLFEAVIDFLSCMPDVLMVLLPRNEKQAAFIRKSWSGLCNNRKIIIPDHVVDGLNLMWYSDLVISGGGTMNREAAALGIPVYSIFRGKVGAVDRYLSDNRRLTLLESIEDVRTKIALTKRNLPTSIEHVNSTTLKSIVDTIVSHIENS